jgi:mannose-6-phosphate isomerase-like protein (cupin superfamily)
MKVTTPRDFTAATAWDALAIAEIEGATIRLHWTDRPYIWHVNDGAEVFVVLEGAVAMHYRRDAEPGDEHVAHPQGTARVLVIEKKGSV